MDNASLAMSVIVVGEVRDGATGNDSAVEEFDTLTQAIEILDVDRETAVVYAELRSSLRKSGMLMSDNDLWIAATALRHGLTLISRDKAFDRVPDLKLMR
jgi:tRNA(fMet)-specific endonuclease VapC